MSKPIDEGFTTHTFDHEAAYAEAMKKSEEYRRAAEVGQPAPDPVQGGPYTPGHANRGH
jgi:hypothetical protein